jgi:L-ascorbate metabolism protein UlaG (beta-lactamase superfamily)
LIPLIYPYQKNKRFYNYKYHRPESFLFGTVPALLHTLWYRASYKKQNFEEWIEHSPMVVERSVQPVITWIGHATFLIQIGGINILTDPIFGKALRLFPRLLPCGLTINQLPPIDIVLISHNHFDHLDKATVVAVNKASRPLFLVPQGNGTWFRKNNVERVQEYMWWEKYTVERSGDLSDVVCTFLPAFHWSGRGLFDKNKSLWGSWMVSCGMEHIYFGGDTAHGPHFEQIGQQFNTIATALLPLGPVEPTKWMRHNHMNAQQVVKAFIALKARQLVPMHWGAFAFGSENCFEVVDRVRVEWQECSDLLEGKGLRVLKVGGKLN